MRPGWQRLAGPSRRSPVKALASYTRQLSSRRRRQFDEVVFSGIQPTGTPHLGNYLGLFLPFLDLQRSAGPSTPVYLSIVGLHAITIAQDPAGLVRDRRNMLAALLASGVDPARTCLYFQEDVPEHAELAWYLNTITPVGRLQRMTTWKSKIATARNTNDESEVTEADLRLGLLAYPVLQAADIMLYKSTVVPVGDDQTQHLELARDIAEGFNRQFGPVFPLPNVRVARILSLRDPSAKMSKSAPNAASRISITDTPTEITSKIKSAVTDSIAGVTYDPTARPGVANLLTIWSALDPAGRSAQVLAEEAAGWGMGQLKTAVADVVIGGLAGVRSEYERIRDDEAWLKEVAARGRDRARETAAQTMDEVRRVVGLSSI